jgi:hypothetical protein
VVLRRKTRFRKKGVTKLTLFWDREWVDDDGARFDIPTTSWKVAE